MSLTMRGLRFFLFNRSGTLWGGRYRSCLVQEERYLLELDRYIERNPVRAGMVMDPGDYKWSSYAFKQYTELLNLVHSLNCLLNWLYAITYPVP